MKGSLLLSLGLLLVILGSSSQNFGATQAQSSSSTTTPQSSPTSSSSTTSSTTQPPTSSSSTTTPQSSPTSSSSTTSSTTQPPTSSSSTTTPQSSPTSSSSTTSSTTQPPISSSSTTTPQSSPTSSSSTTSATTQPTGSASSTTTPQTSPTGSSSTTSATTQPTGSASSTTTGGSSQTSGPTQPPGGASSSTVTSTGPSDPCSSDPCKEPASCIKLHNSRFCLCLEGYYYNETESPSCVKGKTFPGEITMSARETDELEDKNSENYQNLYKDVVNFFKKAFNQPDYGQTIILKVSTTSSRLARAAMPVYVSVVNIFSEDTKEDEDSVKTLIDTAVKNEANVQNYISQNLCDYYGCVNNGSNGCQDGLQCTCKPGLERVNPQVPFCVAAATCSESCSESCNAENKEQCVKSNSGQMECVCMPGYQRASGNGNCEECPFGYSGVDCKDQFQLILTIVGTVGGALILILLISFIVTVRSKNKKKNVEEQKLIEDDFHNVRLRQTGFSNHGADNSIFPKVRTGVQNQTTNPYANQRSMPRPDY